MKIGITIRLFTPQSGGLQQHAAALISHLRARGHEVVIVTRAISRAPSFQDFFYFSEPQSVVAALDSNIRILQHARWLNPLMWVVFKCVGRPSLKHWGVKLYKMVYARKMRRCLANVDLVHHIGQGSEMIGFAAAEAARSLKVPFVVQPTIHPGQWGDGEIDFMLYRAADRLLVHTDYEKDFFKGHGLTNAVSVVGNGIEDRNDGHGGRFREQYGISGRMILFVGRKDADKGYPLILDAFTMARQQCADLNLVCMGPGKPVSRTASGVIEIGFTEEAGKHDALAACDLLCVPSEAESFGLIYMEAARYRKAILARRLPVLEELLGAKGAAVLLGQPQAFDNRVELSADTLAAGILQLLANSEERERMGENAFQVSQAFLWSAVAMRFEEAYREVMGKRSLST